MSRKDYHTRYEPIWYGWLGNAKALCHLRDRSQNDVWEIPRPKKSEEHPTMKPITLAARALNNSSRHGDIVLDPFGGSGTTLMAAEQTDRRCNMMELSERYCDVICRRFRDYKKSDEGIFLLRDGKQMMYHEVNVEDELPL
jgi:DNA modification methylase